MLGQVSKAAMARLEFVSRPKTAALPKPCGMGCCSDAVSSHNAIFLVLSFAPFPSNMSEPVCSRLHLPMFMVNHACVINNCNQNNFHVWYCRQTFWVVETMWCAIPVTAFLLLGHMQTLCMTSDNVAQEAWIFIGMLKQFTGDFYPKSFCLFSTCGTNLAHDCLIRSYCVTLACVDPYEIPTSFATSWSVILQSARTSCLTFSIISVFMDVEGLPLWGSSSTVSSPFLNRFFKSFMPVHLLQSMQLFCHILPQPAYKLDVASLLELRHSARRTRHTLTQQCLLPDWGMWSCCQLPQWSTRLPSTTPWSRIAISHPLHVQWCNSGSFLVLHHTINKAEPRRPEKHFI